MEKAVKKDLVEAVNKKTGYEKVIIKACIDGFLSALKEDLQDGKTVELRGFGVFELRTRRGRENGRNPKTGEPLMIKPKKAVFFCAGRELKSVVCIQGKKAGSPFVKNDTDTK
jgi:integration host factor subunit beta